MSEQRVNGRFAQTQRDSLGEASVQLRQPSVAELIAHRLRERILEGQLRDGDLLPKQEDLLAEFGVSKPSVREALRILETEGLISVRRGKTGGAVVHAPKAENVAYTLELVLRAQNVDIDDVAIALRNLEPVCASLCAARPDRQEAVIAELRPIHEEAARNIDDVLRFTRLSRLFHEKLVACCGNETLIMVVGALEAIWTAHATAWAVESTDHDEFPDEAYRQRGWDDHELLLRLIERGDGEAVAREAHSHLAWAPTYEVMETLPPKGHVLLQRTAPDNT
ncbi:MAG: FadR/GntR family transcriptional regulator [Acidimicrobiia bacterium]